MYCNNVLYARVVRFCCKIMAQKKYTGENLEENVCFKDSLQDWRIVFILISSKLKRIPVQEELSFTRCRFKPILKFNKGFTYPILLVHIQNAEQIVEIEYDLQDSLVAYYHSASNICCLSSLASVFTASVGKKTERAATIRI